MALKFMPFLCIDKSNKTYPRTIPPLWHPGLQRHYRNLEALALDRDEPEAFEDLTGEGKERAGDVERKMLLNGLA